MAKKKKKETPKQQKKFSEKEYLRTKMRSLPLGKCYIGPPDSDVSEVNVFVTRLHPAGTISFGSFLVDKYCCGVKDVLFHFSMDKDMFDELIEKYRERIGIKEVPYVEAHNLIYGAKEYAEEIGIPPHDDFEFVQYVLEEDNDDVPLIEYEFGYKGKPLLICNSNAETEYYKNMMLKVIGPDDFETILSKPINEFEDSYEIKDDDDSGSYEPMIYRDNVDNGFSLKSVIPVMVDNGEVIKELDPTRKIAFFFMMVKAASFVKSLPDLIKPFVDAAERAIANFKKYGDLAFGESAELLFVAVKAAYELISKPFDNLNDEETGALLCFCIGYSYGPDWINLTQCDEFSDLLSYRDYTDQRMLGFLQSEMDSTLNSFKEWREDAKTDEVPYPFNVSLKNLLDVCPKSKVHTKVKSPKYGFVSKDPQNYYKRKVLEVINTEFKTDEDFLGLPVVFNNMVLSALDMIKNEQYTAAYYLLSSILIETLWAVQNRLFDKWMAPGSDGWNCMKVMLANSVSILAKSINCEFVPENECHDVYFELLRLQLLRDISDLVDVHPVIYAIRNLSKYKF